MTLKEYLDAKKKNQSGFFVSWTWTTDEVSAWFKKVRLKRALKQAIKKMKEKKHG